jgi:PPM family protein phosphatase
MKNIPLINKSTNLIGFGQSNIGGSDNFNEDRCVFENITTMSGMDISLAIVADGVGGSTRGERAAQLTVDTIIHEFKGSSTTDILQLMGEAIGSANRAVYAEAQDQFNDEQMASTVAIAAIYDQRLYVANVGDSRVYLIRNDQLTQLTIDHTWANEQIRFGRLSKERALNHPHAEFIARSVGIQQKVKVDRGLYLKGGLESNKEAFHNQGLELDSNDLVLVCSDGLIKSHQNGTRFIEDDEIVDVILAYNPEQAVRELIGRTVGYGTDDNVAVAVVEMPERRIGLVNRAKGRFKLGISAAVMLSVTLCVLAVFGFFGIRSLIPEPVEPTPIPGFAYVSNVSGVTENQHPGSDYRQINKGDSVPFGHGSLVRVLDGVAQFNTPGNFRIYAMGDANKPTIIEFFKDGDLNSEGDQTIIRLLDGTIIVDKNEASASNITFVVKTVSGQAFITGTVMGDRYNSGNQVFDIDCFAGNCQLHSGDNIFNLIGGEHSWVDSSGNINNPDGINYDNYGELLGTVFEFTETPTFVPTDITITPTNTSPPTNTPAPIIILSPTPHLSTFTPVPANYDRCGTLEARGTQCP